MGGWCEGYPRRCNACEHGVETTRCNAMRVGMAWGATRGTAMGVRGTRGNAEGARGTRDNTEGVIMVGGLPGAIIRV